MTSPDSDGTGDPPLRVSTLELFFDLVFVFTITQLTSLLAHYDVLAVVPGTWCSAAEIALLALIVAATLVLEPSEGSHKLDP
jgi:low temperature requirement protein LtrA